MRLGEKIRTLREIRNITAKDMAAELDMTLAGYSKIERDEVDINTEKIEKISNRLGIKPHELLLDDKVVFHFSNNEFTNSGFNGYNIHNFPEELKNLYEDKIKLLEEKVALLENDKLKLKEEIERLKSK